VNTERSILRKIERLLHILSLLKANKRVQLGDLVERCGVSERTIYRDIVDISASNIPIYYDKGYRIMSDGVVPPTCLSEPETKFLLNLLANSRTAQKPNNQKTANRIIDKIKAFENNRPSRFKYPQDR
jgi:predicted DNA-binding transcriptional regulator YafY